MVETENTLPVRALVGVGEQGGAVLIVVYCQIQPAGRGRIGIHIAVRQVRADEQGFLFQGVGGNQIPNILRPMFIDHDRGVCHGGVGDAVVLEAPPGADAVKVVHIGQLALLHGAVVIQTEGGSNGGGEVAQGGRTVHPAGMEQHIDKAVLQIGLVPGQKILVVLRIVHQLTRHVVVEIVPQCFRRAVGSAKEGAVVGEGLLVGGSPAAIHIVGADPSGHVVVGVVPGFHIEYLPPGELQLLQLGGAVLEIVTVGLILQLIQCLVIPPENRCHIVPGEGNLLVDGFDSGEITLDEDGGQSHGQEADQAGGGGHEATHGPPGLFGGAVIPPDGPHLLPLLLAVGHRGGIPCGFLCGSILFRFRLALLFVCEVVVQLILHRDRSVPVLLLTPGLTLGFLACQAGGLGFGIGGRQDGAVAVLKQAQLGIVVLGILDQVEPVVGRHDQNGGKGGNDQGDAQVGGNAVGVNIEGQDAHQAGGADDGRGDQSHTADKAEGEQDGEEQDQKADAILQKLPGGGGRRNGHLVLYVGKVAHPVEPLQTAVEQSQYAIEKILPQPGHCDQPPDKQGGTGGQSDEGLDAPVAEKGTQGDRQEGEAEDVAVGHAVFQGAGQEDGQPRHGDPDDQCPADIAAYPEGRMPAGLVRRADERTLV